MTRKNNDTLVVLTPAFPRHESETYWVPSQQLMVKALKRNYPEVNILVLSILYPATTDIFHWHGVKVIPFNGIRLRQLRRPLRWYRVWQALRAIRRENKLIGILSFWCGECALIGKYFGQFFRVPHCCWICGQDAKKENKLVRFIRPKPVELAAMSPFLADHFFKNHGIRPAWIIPNAVDTASFPLPPVGGRDIDILGAGSFEPLKQYDLFTKAVGAIHKQFPAIKAYHCGMGVEKEKVGKLIDQLGLQNNLFLLGGKPQEEVLQLMQRTKIFLHTSRYEGFSTVCLEALYAGAHVISFCYPLRDAVPHWHVVNNLEEMISKAMELLQDPAMTYPSVKLYDMDDSAKTMMRLLRLSAVEDNAVDVPSPAERSVEV